MFVERPRLHRATRQIQSIGRDVLVLCVVVPSGFTPLSELCVSHIWGSS